MEHEVIDSHSLMTTARTWWFVLVASAALGALAGWAVVARSADVYESTARVVVGPFSRGSRHPSSVRDARQDLLRRTALGHPDVGIEAGGEHRG